MNRNKQNIQAKRGDIEWYVFSLVYTYIFRCGGTNWEIILTIRREAFVFALCIWNSRASAPRFDHCQSKKKGNIGTDCRDRRRPPPLHTHTGSRTHTRHSLMVEEEEVSETRCAAKGKRQRQLFVLPPRTLKSHRARLCAPLIETGIEGILDLT